MEFGEINVFDVIIFLSAIQGILFAVYLLFQPLRNKKANLYLVLFILSFSFNSIFYFTEGLGLRGGLNIWDFSPMFCSLLILPSFYFFIHFLIFPDRKLKGFDFLLFVPFVFQLLVQLWGTMWHLLDSKHVYDHAHEVYRFYDLIDIFLLVFGITILIVSVMKIRRYERNLKENFAEIGEYSLQWLNNLIFVLFGLWILFLIPTIFELMTGNSPMEIYYPMWIATCALIYWIGYSTYLRKRRSLPVVLETKEAKPLPTLSDNTAVYHQALLNLMKEEKIYLDQDLNLKLLADRLDISGGYLSQIINQLEGKNFFDFVNSYRVESVKEKIKDPAYSHLNLLGIAYESGFKSKSTFNLTFKKLTGQTPSGYKKGLKGSQ